MCYINKKKDNLVYLYNIDPKKFWRKIPIHLTNKNNMIPLKDCNSYLKNIYESPNVVENIQTHFIKDWIFSLENKEFGYVLTLMYLQVLQFRGFPRP